MKEWEGYEEFKKHTMSWKKQKVKREEKVNIKMQQLTIENKELKKMMVEWTSIH